MAITTDTRDGISLSCSPSKEGETVVFDYTLANGSSRDAYVSDAALRIDSEARKAMADPDGVAIWLSQDRYATVLKGVAALPPDRDIPGQVMPLMHRLAPGERIERKLVLALPLAEHSPYYSVTNLRDYRLADIDGMRLAIDVLPVPAAPPNALPFRAAPVPYAEGFFDVGLRGTLPLMRRLTCGFRAKGLHLMTRSGTYARPD